MQTVAIFSGNFTNQGNFSGYTAAGERIHISGRQLESIGLSKESKIEYPIYALVQERTFNKLDADGNPTEETFTRKQAGSVFLNKANMIAAANADKVLEIEVQADLKQAATAAGLTTESVSKLLELA